MFEASQNRQIQFLCHVNESEVWKNSTVPNTGHCLVAAVYWCLRMPFEEPADTQVH